MMQEYRVEVSKPEEKRPLVRTIYTVKNIVSLRKRLYSEFLYSHKDYRIRVKGKQTSGIMYVNSRGTTVWKSDNLTYGVSKKTGELTGDGLSIVER